MRALIEAATAGDETAFAELAERTGASCGSTATGCWGRSRSPRTSCRRRTCARGGTATASDRTAAGRCGPGCTGSRRTRVSTRSTKPPRRLLASQLGPAAVAPERRAAASAGDPVAGAVSRPAARAPTDERRSEIVAARETMEIAFLAAIQLLASAAARGADPARRAGLVGEGDRGGAGDERRRRQQRAAARPRDAQEAPPARRGGLGAQADATDAGARRARRFMDAFERADIAAVAALLRRGRVREHAAVPGVARRPRDDHGRRSRWLSIPRPSSTSATGAACQTRANMQPAAGFYVRRPGDDKFRAFALDVLTIEDGG